MDSAREIEFEARLGRVEQSIALLQRSVDALLDERKPRPVPIPASRQKAADGIGDNIASWFSSRSPEWWLSRLGIGFVVLAVLLLYKYAIDKGWITPPIRVLAGTLLGGGLFWAATRTSPAPKSAGSHDLGLRELFFGGALAVWYVTAYAAAAWYQVISIPSARFVFFLLAILSTWIALQERREIFAFLAVATGFATPFILAAPVRSLTGFSLYMGAMAAIGLTIYLMRGWPSIVWITFAGFWLSVAGVTTAGGRINPSNGSLALTTLVILVAAALVRVPTLRRELLVLGSKRYTALPISSGIRRLMHALDSLAEALGGGGRSAPDSLVLWLVPLLSPILAADSLENIWPTAPKAIWGLALLVLGVAAFVLARGGGQPDAEVTHVEVTAAVLWAALGIERVASLPEGIPLASGLAALVLVSSEFVPSARPYAGARAVAKATIAIALLSIAGHELDFADVGLLHLRWVLSGIATIGCAALIAQALIEDPTERMQGIVLAVAGYLTGLVVVWRALEPVWAPLVTTSYAVAGALLLVMSRRPGSNPLLKHLGGATMLIVVLRLLLVDLSRVETIWRVLLFLVCGAVFLYTGYRMQLRPTGETDK
jgi:predicted membrane protein DUF2339